MPTCAERNVAFEDTSLIRLFRTMRHYTNYYQLHVDRRIFAEEATDTAEASLDLRSSSNVSPSLPALNHREKPKNCH